MITRKKHNENKYFESIEDDSFVLSISAVNATDIGDYLVTCGKSGDTDRSNLKVTVNNNGEFLNCLFFFWTILNDMKHILDSKILLLIY
jgi:hypothetical protein